MAYLQQFGLSESMQIIVSNLVFVTALLIGAIILQYINRSIVLVVIERIIRKTEVTWDDKFLERKVFTRAIQIIPILLVYLLIPKAVQLEDITLVEILQKVVRLYMVVWAAVVVNSVLLALNDIYEEFDFAAERPIKGIIQTIQIIVFLVAAIFFISIILNKSVTYLLAGLGTMTAILMLVFKDSLLGLTAGIQMAFNRTIRLGDWITVPNHNADGTVIEITLNFVKVQNWDNTITILPSYTLVSTAFQNWKGVQETGARRIKRHLVIDQSSVKFCTPEMLERFKKIDLIKDYVNERAAEIEKYNQEKGVNTELAINGRRMTNLGTFRRYVTEYLKNHPKIRTDLTLVVRYLQPTDRGLPIELYVYSSETGLVDFEAVQSDIFDHLLASIETFELKLFQSPTSSDFKQLAGILNVTKA